MKKKPKSVVTILERELEPMINEWLRRVNLLSELTTISLSGEDRTLHLPKLFRDIACRLRLVKGAQLPISTAATDHGRTRRHQGELDQNRLLLDVVVIADEADLQLMEAIGCGETQPAQLV